MGLCYSEFEKHLITFLPEESQKWMSLMTLHGRVVGRAHGSPVEFFLYGIRSPMFMCSLSMY